MKKDADNKYGKKRKDTARGRRAEIRDREQSEEG